MTILDTVIESITVESTSSMALGLGESPDSIQRGLEMATASILSRLSFQASKPESLLQIFPVIYAKHASMAAAAGSDTVVDTGPPSLVNIALGDSVTELKQTIAQASGLRPSSVPSVLAAAARLVQTALEMPLHGGPVTPAALAEVLMVEKETLHSFLPPGFDTFYPLFPAPAPRRPNGWPRIGIFLVVAILLLGLARWLVG